MFFRLSKFFLSASLFSVVLVTSSTLFPFIVGKYSFFRACVDFSLVFFLLGLLTDPRAKQFEERAMKVLRHPLSIAVAVFVFVYVLAGVVGIEPSFSFWSNFERGEGGLQMIHFFAFFVLFGTLFTEEKDWKNAFTAWASASFLVIVYGVLAMAGTGGFIANTVGLNFTNRFQGSLGNPDYSAPYLVFSIVFALFMFFLGRKRKMSLGPALCVLIPAFFFWWAQTRGALVGVVFALGSFLLFLVAASENMKLKKIGAGALVFFAILGGVLYANRHSPIVQSIPGSRLFDISFSSASGQPRLWTWGQAIEGWKDYPVLGWGPENFSGAFNAYFDARHFNPNAGGETWFDRAHSMYLDYLTMAGVVGLAAFLALIVAFYFLFFRSGYARDGSRSVLERGLVFSVPVFYLGQGITLFEVLPIYLGFFLFLAYAMYRFINTKKQQVTGKK